MLSSLHHRWSKQQCNIIAMASLKLAIKLLEPRTMNMEDMLKLGSKLGGSFSPLQVVEMENEVIWKLSWNVLPPTAFCFAHHMICMLPSEVPKTVRYILQELTKYMTELAVCEYGINACLYEHRLLSFTPSYGLLPQTTRCVQLRQVQGLCKELCGLFSCDGKVGIFSTKRVFVALHESLTSSP